MNEFTVHLVSSASMKIFPQKTMSSIENFFNEEINFEGVGDVSLELVPMKILTIC